MRSRLIILLLTFIVIPIGYGQEDGEIQFLVDVDNGYFEIVINDSIYLKKYKTKLPAGEYTAKVWSPGYITNEVDFEIVEGEVTKKYVQMAISNQRLDFERDYKAYRMKFHKSLTVPASFALASTLTTGYFMIKTYSLRNKIFTDMDSYHISVDYGEILTLKDRIRTNNIKYDRNRVLFYSTLGLSAALIGTTIFTYTRFKRNEIEPVFNSESPFKDRFSLNISPLGFNLKYNLN